MSEKCGLAARRRVAAVYRDGHILLVAEGDKPTPCHVIRFERSPLTVEPPRFILRSCVKPDAICIQVITPYRAIGTFFIGAPRPEVLVEHAEGTDRVPVMGVPDKLSDDGSPLVALGADAAAPKSGENPFPWKSIDLKALIDGRFRILPVVPRRATGYSDNFDFNEAFRDALASLPPAPDQGADWMTTVRVMDVGALLGGIVGFHRLFVSIEAH